MDDAISRQGAIDAVYDAFCYAYCDNCEKEMNEDLCGDCHRKYQNWSASKKIIEKVINNLPSVQPEIIRCKDCRWWDKYDNYDNGYCMAAKHGYLSEHWEISIRRTYKGDFYCADAEPKGEQE